MMECRLATTDEIAAISKLSVSLGNVPFQPGVSVVAALFNLEPEDVPGFPSVVGFTAVTPALTAAGSWVKENHRGHRFSFDMRRVLEDELRRLGAKLYIAIPNKESEHVLFSKFGLVTEHVALVRHL